MAKKDTLHIRTTEDFKKRLREESKEVKETPSEYVRKACEQRWEKDK